MMIKNKLSKLLDEHSEFLKRLGIYMVIVLFIFALSISYMLDKIKDKQNEITSINTPPENIITAKEKDEPSEEPIVEKILSEEKQSQEELKPEGETKLEEDIKKDDTDVSNLDVSKKNTTENTKVKEAENQAQTQLTKEEADNILATNNQPLTTNLSFPLQGQIITNYELIYWEAYGDYRFHPGIDIKEKIGSEVKAALAGKVLSVEKNEEQNITIIIDHGNGWHTHYSHLGQALVNRGESIEKGEKIGLLGEPGLIEKNLGPHLHFALKQNDQWQDPTEYLKK